jgi:hypothetical protein
MLATSPLTSVGSLTLLLSSAEYHHGQYAGLFPDRARGKLTDHPCARALSHVLIALPLTLFSAQIVKLNVDENEFYT